MTKPFRFYSWEKSATGDWSPDTGLYRLRDDSPTKLADWLWENGIRVQQTATIELMAHGNLRKAAELVRALAEQHPFQRPQIRDQYGCLSDVLFDSLLESLPSSPAEYPISSRVKAAVNGIFDR